MLTSYMVHIVLLLFFLNSPQPNDILGVWLTADKDGHVEIFEENGKYFGKIIWAEDMYEDDSVTLSKDNNNPDPEMRQRTIKNLVIIENFVFENGEWRNGNIYDPNNGRTEVWTRIKTN